MRGAVLVSPSIGTPLNLILPPDFSPGELRFDCPIVFLTLLSLFACFAAIFYASPPFERDRATAMVGQVDTFGPIVVVSYFVPLWIANTFIGALYGRVRITVTADSLQNNRSGLLLCVAIVAAARVHTRSDEHPQRAGVHPADAQQVRARSNTLTVCCLPVHAVLGLCAVLRRCSTASAT